MGAYENWKTMKEVIKARAEETSNISVSYAYNRLLEQMDALDDQDKGEMYDTLARCFDGVFDRKPTVTEIEEISKKVPDYLKQHADQWGWDDTDVGDQVYEWIERQKNKGVIV